MSNNIKIIWVRHGTVKKECPYDTLTTSGQEFANNLPGILEKNRLGPEAVFYCSYGKLGAIDRCKNTVENLRGFAEPYTKAKDISIFENCKCKDVILICYTVESLSDFPDICLSMIKRCHRKEKAQKTLRNWLYENIIVSKYDGSEIKNIDIIKTGDGRNEKRKS